MSGRSLEDLRASNRHAIAAMLAAHGPRSRADLARATGLSPTTVSSLVTELIDEGLAREADRGRPHKGGSGRPPLLVALTARPGLVGAVDVGHRHLHVAVADRSAQVVAEQRLLTDTDSDGAATLDAAASLLRKVCRKAETAVDDLLSVGLCVPGPIDHTSARVNPGILPGWRDIAPADELARRVGGPVVVDNDANLGALAEHRHGAARGVDDMLYVKLASGVGAGIVLGGRLHRGTSGIAGELGHVMAREQGHVCRCGSRGCLETEVSATRVLDLLRPLHGPALELDGLLSLERAGDSGVRRVLTDAGHTVGRALADLCTTLNPALVVVGGSLGAATSVVLGIRTAVDRYAQPNAAAAVEVVSGEFGDRAELIGALAMAISRATETSL